MRSLSSRLFMICHVWERVLFVLIFWLFHHIFQSMNFVNTFNVLGLPNWMLVQMNIRKIIIIITRNNQTAYSPWSIFNYLFILFFANNFFRAIETQSMAWETDSIANERQCTFMILSYVHKNISNAYYSLWYDVIIGLYDLNDIELPNWMLVQMYIRKIIITIRNYQTVYSSWSMCIKLQFIFPLFAINSKRTIVRTSFYTSSMEYFRTNPKRIFLPCEN